MKQLLTGSLTAFILSSCAPAIKTMVVQCDSSPAEILRNAKSLVIKEGFQIKEIDTTKGFLRAETIPETDISGSKTEYTTWLFQIRGNKLYANVKKNYTIKNLNTLEVTVDSTYFDDLVLKRDRYNWYWKIRNGVESICGNKIVFIGRGSFTDY